MSKELEVLAALSNFNPGAIPAPSGLGDILGRNLIDLPGRAANSLIGDVNSFANLGAPAGTAPAPYQIPDIVQGPTTNSQSSGVEKIADMITGGLAPEVAALAVPYLGVSKLAGAAGFGAKAASLLADVGTGIVSGAPRGIEGIGQDVAAFAGINMGLTGLGKIWGGVKPAAEALAPEVKTIIPDEIIPPSRRNLRLPGESADVSGPVIAPEWSPTLSLEDRALRMHGELQTPSGPTIPVGYSGSRVSDVRYSPFQKLEETGSNSYRDIANLQSEELSVPGNTGRPSSIITDLQSPLPSENTFGKSLIVDPRETFAAGKPIIEVDPSKPRANIFAGKTVYDLLGIPDPSVGPYRPLEGKVLNPSKGKARPINSISEGVIPPSGTTGGSPEMTTDIHQDPTKSRIHSLPEYKRTEGGGILGEDSALFRTLLLSGIGGAAGGLAGGLAGKNEESVGAGAVLGLLTPWALRAFMAKSRGEIGGIFNKWLHGAEESGAIAGPAWRLPGGEVIAGTKGQGHWSLMDRIPNTINPMQLEDGFVNDTGEFLTRKQANDEALIEGQIDKATHRANNRVRGLITEQLNSESGSVGGNKGMKLPKETTWMEDALAERRAKGWDDKWPFIPADLQNASFVEGIKNDSTLSKEVKERILSFAPSLKNSIAGDFKAGTSNLSATIEKNISDAKMMNPEHPEVFLRQMATAAHQKGNTEAAANFEAAIANLQKKSSEVVEIPKGECKECFNNARKFASEHEDKGAIVVHGKAHTLEGKTIDHAWVEIGDRVYDPTIGKSVPKDFYYSQVKAVPETTFTPTQANINMIRANTPGPWTAEEIGNRQLGFKLKSNDITASASLHAVLPIAGAAIGATTGYKEDGVEGALTGAILGGSLGILGARGLDRLHLTGPETTAKMAASTVKTSVEKGFKAAFDSPAKDLGGQDVYGRGGIIPKFFRAAENLFNFGLPAELHSTVTRARGFASEIIDHATTSLKSAVRFNPSDEIKLVTNKFLSGEILDDAAFLKENGAITEEAFSRLNSTAKEELASWTRADRDAKGNIIGTKVYVKPEAKDKFLSLQEQAYLKALPEDWHEFANLQISMRRSMNELQRIIGDALPQGNLKTKVQDSVGRYVPRMYRIFSDSKYHVTEQQIDAAATEFGLNKAQGQVEAAIAQHMGATAADHNELVAKLSQKKDMQSQIRMERLSKFQKVSVGKEEYFVSPEIAASLSKFGNEDYLKNEIRSYLSDIKSNREVYGAAKGIDKTLFMEREDIGSAWRDMLGEYSDPTERMAMGLEKMYAPAQAARLISTVKDMVIDDLPISLSGDSWTALNTKLKASGDIANLQKLNAYKKLASDIKYGDYSGLYVHRFLADYLQGDSRMWESGIGRSMASFNQIFKTAHVPLNPISQLRQIISMPVFAVIGRASPASMSQAFDAWKGINPELKAEMIREGIWTADFIRGELSGNISSIMNGRYDSSLVRKLKQGYEGILEGYRIPDMVTRGGTYIGAKNRIASELSLALNHPDVIAKAVEWTDRYTMNYDNISRAVRVARNIPFVNPFISFQAEVLRIMKNLVIDSSKGNVERLAVLGGLVAAPEILMKTAEGSLSTKDRKEWEKMKVGLPAYMRDSFLLPIAKLQNGKFKYVSISPIIPQDNFQQAVKAMATGDKEAFMAVNPFLSSDKSPLFNLITEAVTGESRQTGLKYRDSAEQLGSMVSEILPPLAPGGYEWNKLANVNVENLRSGKVENWGDIALRYTTGLSLGVLKPDAVMKSAQGKLKSDIANLRSYYLQVAKTSSPDEVKKKSYDDYRQGVQLLIHDFAERFAE